MTNPVSALAVRSSRWSARHPWRAMLGWLAFVALAVVSAATISTQPTTEADWRIGESGRAAELIDAGSFEMNDTENVLITARSGQLDVVQADRAARQLAEQLGALDPVKGVTEPQTSADGSTLLVQVYLLPDQGDVAALQSAAADVQSQFPDLLVREAGEISVDSAISDRVAEDLGSAESLSLPLTLILMLLAFGALIAAGIPVLLAATSVTATIGLTAPISHLVHAEETVTSMIVLIGMAVGVDYSLFFLKRAREERESGRPALDAVEIAAETSGHSILVSGVAVIAAMSGLFILGDATFNSLAVGSILVVGIAVMGSITVLPALLVKLGRWVDRPRIPLLWRVNRRIGRGGISGRVLSPVIRHPGVALTISTVAVVLVAIPALGMRTHSANIETLPSSIPEVQTLRDLADAFPAEGTTAELVVSAPATSSAAVSDAFVEVVNSTAASGLFEGAAGPIAVSADRTISVLTLAIPFDESDQRVDDAIRLVRTKLAPEALDDLPGVEYAVGGDPADSLDTSQRQSARLPWVIGFVLLLTMLILGWTFRSVPLALVTAALNLASVGVSFGLITLVFQHGWFEGALDFTSPGFVIDWLPIFVLVVLVGLSMDYHVFVLSRVAEHVRRGLPTSLAVRAGIADTAGVVTSAATVMVSVFAIFATLSMMEMKTMGVGLSAAILVDATLVRLVMLPAALCLLGDRAWWPTRPQEPMGEPVLETEPAFSGAAAV